LLSHIVGNDHYASQVWEEPDMAYIRLMNQYFDLNRTDIRCSSLLLNPPPHNILI
jgi:hypothetical protein